MGSNEFFLQSNNGKRIRFEDLKKLKLEDIAQNPALQELVALFDNDKSGNINTPDEWNTIFGELQAVAQEDGDNVLSYSEMGLFLRRKSINKEIKEEDYENLIAKIGEENSGTHTIFYEENGVNYENIVTVEDGKIQKIVKKQDGIVLSTTEYSYLDDGTVKLNTKNLNNDKVETLVSEVDEEGNYLAENFISRTTTLNNGNVVSVSKLETGHIVEVIEQGDTSLTTIYNTPSVYAYDYFKDEEGLKFGQVYTNADKEYFVRYENGNTVTHAASGDGLERLTRNFGFENIEHFYELNPDMRGKVIQVGQDVVVPNILDANDPRIVRQGTLLEEYTDYLEFVEEQNLQSFKDENFANIDQEFFELLQTVNGFELNNENLQMYYKISLLKTETQKALLEVFAGLKDSNALETLTPYDIKRMILTSPRMPKEKLDDGAEIPINLFEGVTLSLKDPVTSVVDTTVLFSYEMFIKEKLGLDITFGQGKELYERMLSIKDTRVITDMLTMFDNIRMRSDDYLYENFSRKMDALAKYHEEFGGDFTKVYRAVRDFVFGEPERFDGARTYLGKEVKKAQRRNGELSQAEAIDMYNSVILELTEPPQKTKHHEFVENLKDTYLRQFAADMIYMLHMQSADLLAGTRARKGVLSPSKYLLGLPQQVYRQGGERIYNIMELDVYLGNDKFSASQKTYTAGNAFEGMPFDKEKIKKCYQIICDKNASDAKKKQALIDVFGGPIVNEAENLIETTDFLDNVAEIALLIYGTGIIGKGLTTGVSALRSTSVAQKASVLFHGAKASSFTNFAIQSGISAGTFAIYDGLKYTIDYYTNDIDETQLGENSYSYWEGLGSTVKYSAAFGAFAYGWGQTITSRLLNKVFKTPQAAEVSQKAMRTVNKTFGNSAEFTSSKLMQTYSNAQAKAMTSVGREVVSFGSELVGFSTWEILNSEPDKTVFEVLENQFETLLSFKTVGHIIKMHKAGKGFAGANNFGKVKDLKFEPVSENGKSGYKVTYPDGKESFVRDLNEAVVLSNNYYENKTLYEPLEEILKNEKVDLGKGIVISKEGNNYVVDLNGQKRISEPNLRMAMLKAQNQHSFYKLEEQVRAQHEITLPNQMKITYDKENNMYETVLENGEKIKTTSIEKLFVDASQVQLKIGVDKEILAKGSMMFGEDTRLSKTADNLYQAEVILSNGKKFVVKNEFINDALVQVNFIKMMYERYGEVRTEVVDEQMSAMRVEEYKRNNPLDVEHIRNTYEPNVAELFERCYETHPDFVVEILKSKECDLSNIAAHALSDVNYKIAKLLVCATEHPEMVSYMKGLYSEGYNFSRITSKTREFVAQKRELNNRLTTNEIYTPEDVRDLTRVIENRPELKSDILDCASKKMTYRQTMEEINRLDARRLELRTSLEEKYPEQMAQLKTTLGEEFFSQVKWEKHILSDFSEAQAFEALTELNNSAKFFARTTTNEQRYGKNFGWARSMNEISIHAQEAIRNGKSGREILDLIAQEYGDFDRAGGIEGRENSGKVRQLDKNGEGRMFRTPFDNLECYPEYFDRFIERNGVRRTRPYEDIGLTTLFSDRGDTNGQMFHPTSDLVQPCLRHVECIHNEMQPLFDKVTIGETLTEADIATAHSKISEIYFLLGNTAPYERGSNGIADIYMRSMYEALKIDMPALKRNISLDLEAFCMDLPEYQSKWLTFFEGKPEVRTNPAELSKGGKFIADQAIDYIHNFDLRPETFKEFLLFMKNEDGENVFTKEKMDGFFSQHSAEDIALRFDVIKSMIEATKEVRLSISDGIESVCDLNNSSVRTLKELFTVPQGQNGSFLDGKVTIGLDKFEPKKLQIISLLVKVAKETNHPLLNRDNIMYLSDSALSKNPELFAKVFNIKDKNGNFILDKAMIETLEREHNISELLEKFTEIDSQSVEMCSAISSFMGNSANYELRIFLVKNVLNKKITKPEQLDKFVEDYFNDNFSPDTKSVLNKNGRSVNDLQCNFKISELNELFEQIRFMYTPAVASDIHEALEKYEILLTKSEHSAFIEMLNSKKLLDVQNRQKLSFFVGIVNAYASLKGFGGLAKRSAVMKYYEQLKKSNPTLAERLENEGKNYKQQGSQFDKATVELRDMIESARVEILKNVLASDFYDKETKDFLYEEYLNTFPCEDVYKNKCREINEKYGVKVIMGAYKEVEALDFVREELQAFRDASSGTAKLIDIFDFTMSSYEDYINPKAAYEQGPAGGYQNLNRVGVNSMRFSSIAHALRHELMHANDLKGVWGLTSKYNWGDIVVKKKNGKFDLSKCKYVNDFRRIGIPEWHIAYAYNNTAEFIAVAAEGDLTKCTPEFKEVLIDFGMPEWMFRIRSHQTAKAQAGVSFETLCALGTDGKTYEITEAGQKIIKTQVEQIRNRAAKSIYEDVQFMYDFGLGNPKSLTYRTKSSTSMFDKVKNYLFDNAKKAPSLADAMLDIRDANGFRTIIENVDYSSHPEVKTLLDAGDKHGAALRAAELQSQPYVDRLIGVMTAFAEGRTNKKPTRISNYMGADGVPYFSERQLAEIQLYAKRCGINLSIVTEFDVRNNSHFTPEEMSAYSKGRTTKVRESGYTALQVNFENGDGTIFEWQLRGSVVDVRAEAEHLWYDATTGKDITSGNPELAILLKDFKELANKDKIQPEDKVEYNRYLTDCYKHARCIELGIPSEAPKLPERFDVRLKVENLDLLHHFMVQVKNGKMTGAEALAEYTRMLR